MLLSLLPAHCYFCATVGGRLPTEWRAAYSQGKNSDGAGCVSYHPQHLVQFGMSAAGGNAPSPKPAMSPRCQKVQEVRMVGKGRRGVHGGWPCDTETLSRVALPVRDAGVLYWRETCTARRRHGSQGTPTRASV